MSPLWNTCKFGEEIVRYIFLQAVLAIHKPGPVCIAMRLDSHSLSFTTLLSKTIRDRIPPSELLSASNSASLSVPSTPAWALAATAPVEWVLRPSQQTTDPIEEQPQQKHQEIDFPDDPTNDDWERCSMASIASDEDDDDHNTTPVDQQETPHKNLQKAHFYESYPMAITAAGLATLSSKKRSLAAKQRATRRQRSLMACLVMIILAAMTAVWSLGYLDRFSMPQRQHTAVSKTRALLPTPTSSSYTQKAIAAVPNKTTLVPASPRSKRSTMVRADSIRSRTSPTVTPQPEQVLQKYLAVDTLLEWKEAAIVTSPTAAPLAKPKIAGPLARQLQKVGKFWRKITSFLFRRNKKQGSSKT